MLSKNFRRQLGGHKAKGAGDAFETHFECTVRSKGCIIIKIPAGGRMVRVKPGKDGLKWIPKKAPFDYVMAKNNLSAFIDTKTTEGKAFKFSDIDQDQLRWLTYGGDAVAAGYVIWFREVDKVTFFNWAILKDLKPRESLKPDGGLLLGSIERYNPEAILSLQPAKRQTTLFD